MGGRINYDSSELVGKVFGSDKYMYTDGMVGNSVGLRVMCQLCGLERVVEGSRFVGGKKYKLCKCQTARDKYTKIIGKELKGVKVIRMIDEIHSSNNVQLEVCCIKCGRNRLILGTKLLSKDIGIKKCYCQGGYDLNDKEKRYRELGYIGEKFNSFIIRDIKLNTENKLVAICDCDCGSKSVDKLLKYVIYGKIKTCGCYGAKYVGEHYLGKTYGNFKVISMNGRVTGKGIMWKVQCLLCNKIVTRKASLIASKFRKSCGCAAEKYRHTHIIGTSVSNIKIKDIRTDMGKGTSWVCECTFCGEEFTAKASHIANKFTKSCGCIGRSFGESVINKQLVTYGVNFVREKTFKGMVGNNGGGLRVDFVIVSNGNMYAIEFDGLQHKYVNHQRGAKSYEEALEYLKNTQDNDHRKNKYLKEKDIKLLRIEYTDDAKVIENILNEYLISNYIIKTT